MKKMTTGPLQQLLREKGNLCVSVIFPASPVMSDRPKDRIMTDKNIAAAFLVIDDYARKQKVQGTDKLKQKLTRLYEQLDFSKAKQGIGLYVSGNVSHLAYFSFPVRQRVLAATSFQVRELVYEEWLSKTYYTLMLSSHSIHLFRCSGEWLEETRDNAFPKKFTDSREYAKPVRGRSRGVVKNAEGDKSANMQQRMLAFFRAADHSLAPYLENGTELVLAGVKKDLALYMRETAHAAAVAGKVEGNFEHGNLRRLEQAAWKKMEKKRAGDRNQELKRLGKVSGTLVAAGLREAWEAAYEGNCLELFVEKDFAKTAFESEVPGKISLRASAGKKSRIIADAVDDLVEMVLAKKGRVLVFENGELEKFSRVALLKRY